MRATPGALSPMPERKRRTYQKYLSREGGLSDRARALREGASQNRRCTKPDAPRKKRYGQKGASYLNDVPSHKTDVKYKIQLLKSSSGMNIANTREFRSR